ncbi:MAG: anti-sigma factor antagonist [Planctomycetota bacterium]|nr:anti-sigma factor antagonist [Planctomycetota bacterium]
MQVALLKELPRLAVGKTQDLHVLVRLEFPAPQESTKRPPIHLALVLDRSGSMAGEKLELTKQSAVFFMNWLTRRDFLTVVTYDDRVDLLVPHTPLTDKRAIAERIKSITSGGQTNLSGGWVRGMAELHEHREPGHLHRLVLLTDGQANSGVTAPEQLAAIAAKNRQREIVTTTVGFGNDFDEKILKSIAESGGGRFHYVKEAEGLAKAFQDEFGELATMVGQNVELRAALNEGVTVADVLTDIPCDRTDGSLRVPMGDARAGDVKLFVFKLRIADKLCAQPGAAALGTLTARCDALSGDMLPESQSLPLESDVADAGEPPALHPEVRREVWLAHSARLKLAAARHLDSGEHHEAAQALRRHAQAAEELARQPTEQLVREEVAQLLAAAEEIERDADRPSLSKQLVHSATQLSARRGTYRMLAGVKKIQAVVAARRPEEIQDVLLALERELHDRGFDVERIGRARLILQELLDNAVEHGCKGRTDAVVRVEGHISDAYVRLIVTDDGPGFDYEAKLTHEKEHVLAPGQRGRGLLLIQRLADRVDFQCNNGTRAEAVVERRALRIAAQHAPRSAAEKALAGKDFSVQHEMRAEKGVVIVKLKGVLDAHTFERVEETVTDLFARGYYKLIVDMAEVDYISSAGAGVFIGALSEAHEHNGDIVLLGPTHTVREVFDLLGLTQIFRVCDDLVAAYALF